MRWLSVVLLLSVACGDDSAPPPTPTDSGRRDGGTDAGAMDGAVEDGAVEDGGGVDAPAEDAPGVDTGDDFDAGTDSGPPDGGFDPESCFDDEGVYDLCLCDTPTCTPGGDLCGPGTTCLPDGCGRNTCQLAGNRCESDADCHPSSSCATLAFMPVCSSGSDSCNDSRDCPLGFSCDAGTCTNRRLACDESTPCPWGFTCWDLDEFVAEPYCRVLYTPCNAFEVCGPAFSCVDLDLDGDNECRPNGGFCDSNEDCPGMVCGSDPTALTDCRATHGPCAEPGDCAAGFDCTDLWGDGQQTCVPSAGGTCARQADCAAGTLCGQSSDTTAPACLGG